MKSDLATLVHNLQSSHNQENCLSVSSISAAGEILMRDPEAGGGRTDSPKIRHIGTQPALHPPASPAQLDTDSSSMCHRRGLSRSAHTTGTGTNSTKGPTPR